MLNPLWSDPPSVELLQWLARGNLKQQLLQALRLWVWLHFLYGEAATKLNLPEPFGYADWRDAFFSETHTKGEEKPGLHDRECFCGKTVAAWLFGLHLNLTQLEWETCLQEPTFASQVEQQQQQFADSLRRHHLCPDNLQKLWETRLFGLTRRALAADLSVLAELQWLKRSGHLYYRVSDRPFTPSAARQADAGLFTYNLDFLTQPDLAAIADNLSARLQGQQRFFLHLEYVITKIDRVDERQAQLRTLWEQKVVPPILLTYWNAAQQTTLAAVVYPVCIYYYQRGPYLCGFGELPPGETKPLDWRNYRLDRIENIEPLSWEAARVPPALKQRYSTGKLPTPDEIQLAMAEAWGFDYYQPALMLLLRFDREWDDRYIRNTDRHATFAAVDYQTAGNLIRQTLKGEQREAMLKVWRARSPGDAYYRATYRQDDPNVMQRLRAWRPRVEILLPVELRERAAREVQQEWKLYHE
ncbi:MAG TPA: TIGR03985 family CRISPR-associated protein [Cyanobacteria bacterium UBA11372]|nr:TIGR03985 family CRISPR-associated protein [Cyanobacteria bacterium UBA11372]